MALRMADVKKTVRARSDGERYLHPKMLRGEAALAQVGLALAYCESRVGRARHEVDPEMLVRFFGDPKVARGIVAALSTTYRWQTPAFHDVLDAAQVARLAARGLTTPGELRLYLYDTLNASGHGFLPAERENHLSPLARRLGLTAGKVDQLIALDAAENAVLVRVASAPAPEEVLARFNFQTADALLRNGVEVELSGVGECAWAALLAACAACDVAVDRHGPRVRLLNRPDAFGSYARAGQRLARALYMALAGASDLLRAGRARVQIGRGTAVYELGKEITRALTAETGMVRCAAPWPELRPDWDRRRAAHGTGDWRLAGHPDPALTSAGLVVAPLACRRRDTQVLLWPAACSGALSDAAALHEAGLQVLAVVPETMAESVPDGLPWMRLRDGAAGLVAELAARWGGDGATARGQALETLLGEAAARGFVPAAEVAAALWCTSPQEVTARLRDLDPARGSYVPGLGLCSPAFAAAMRKGLRRRRVRAA